MPAINPIDRAYREYCQKKFEAEGKRESVRETARKLGLTHAAIYGWLSGHRQPKGSSIKALAHLFFDKTPDQEKFISEVTTYLFEQKGVVMAGVAKPEEPAQETTVSPPTAIPTCLRLEFVLASGTKITITVE